MNTNTFTTHNDYIWYCSYFVMIDNIFCHGRFLFSFVVHVFVLFSFCSSRLTETIHMPCQQFKSWFWCNTLCRLENDITLFLIIMTSFIYCVFLELSCTYLNLAILLVARLICCNEPCSTVQEHLHLAIFSIARLNCYHKPHGIVQEHFTRVILSIARLNLSM